MHENTWRESLSQDQATLALGVLRKAPIKRSAPTRLIDVAWQIAEELGWAKTYDAEYLALARLLDCKALTVDARLHRGSARLGIVVSPRELGLVL